MELKKSLDEKISAFAMKDFVRLNPEDTVSAAAKQMKKAGATEALVTKDGAPIGIITERDIVYKVVAEGSDAAASRVRDVMSSPVESIDESSKVGEAIGKMSKLGVRRLAVTREGKLVGLITQKSVVSGSIEQRVPLPELAAPGVLSCPYCGATMRDGRDLSKHIDQVHLGLGLLEGDSTKW